MEPELALDARALLGEGAVWDAARQVLYWVDIEAGVVHVFDPASGHDEAIPVSEHVGCVAPRAAGGLVLAIRRGFATLDPGSGTIALRVAPELHPPDVRFNDGRVDPAGRLWAGTMQLNCRPRAAALYRLDPDWRVHRMVDEVTISNGIAWTRDSRLMYYVDTPTATVVAFDYEQETGTIKSRRVVVEVPAEMGSPDGMTIDAEDCLWVAQWNGGFVGRWDPRTGRLLERHDLPARRVTSCAFGGSHFDELYVTTARFGLDEATLAAEPHAGGIFRLHPGVVGLPGVAFAG